MKREYDKERWGKDISDPSLNWERRSNTFIVVDNLLRFIRSVSRRGLIVKIIVKNIIS